MHAHADNFKSLENLSIFRRVIHCMYLKVYLARQILKQEEDNEGFKHYQHERDLLM